MRHVRLRRSGPLCAVAALLGALLAPGAAAADGPGYGGTADAVTVQWQQETDSTAGLAVYAVGFRGGSTLALRVGSAADQTVTADPAGALRVLVVSAADAATTLPADLTVLSVGAETVDRLSSGTSVQVIGRNPAGTIRTLIGAVPPPSAGRGVQDLVQWAAALAVLLGLGVLGRRADRGRLAALLRRYRRPALHRA